MFINTSRGEVADSDALKSALITKLIRTAVLDVWENEPDIDQELMGLIGYATPHIAGYSADGKANGTAMAVSSIAEFFDLPIQNFFPSDIPDPESPLDLSASKTPLYTAVTATYDIRKDNSALRNSPDDFEELRENYPLRREFPAYTIKRSANLNAEQIKALATLGFRFI